MNIQSYIKKHPIFNHAYDIAEICAPLKKLGITYFSHVHIGADNCFTGLGSCPEFAKLYFEKNYYQFDLHHRDSITGEQCILWDTIKLTNETQSLEADFTSLDFGHTFSLIYNEGDSKDCYHFAAKLGNVEINEIYLQKIIELKKFICYFREQVARHRLLRQAYALKLRDPNQIGGFCTKNPLSLIEKNQFVESIPYQRIYIDGGNVYLTASEVICLDQFAKGKTTDEIAEYLKITPRTVKAHVRNIKDKLGCENQFQLGVCYAKVQDLIKT